jgi:ketosteroid isomerase-like protein
MEEMKKWILRILAAVVVAFVLWQIWDHVFVTDEKRIKKQIATMTRAVEKGDVLRLADAVAADYSDGWSMDKSTLLGAVRAFRAQYDALFIHISDLDVTIDPDGQTGQAVFIAKVLAKAKGSATESEVRAERFRLHFRKNDGVWRLVRTESPELKFD